MAINSRGKIFAGAGAGRTQSGGVFLSVDNGASWLQTNLDMTAIGVNALAINSADHIFAGSLANGVFRSTDNGDTWQQINAGLMASYVHTLTINDNDEIFAGTENGAYRSVDNGDSWNAITSDLRNYFDGNLVTDVYAIVIDRNGDIVIGAQGGLYRSRDNGDSWVQLRHDLLLTLEIRSLAIVGTDTVFAASQGFNDGLLRSIDNGRTWSAVGTDVFVNVTAMAITDSGTVFAVDVLGGVLRSFDYGKTWTSAIPEGSRTLAINDSGHVFAGGIGVFRTLDNGDSWSPQPGGLVSNGTYALAAADDDYLFAATQGAGLFRSDNKGDNWTQTNIGLTSSDAFAVLVKGSNIFVGTGDTGDMSGGVFRSNDQGNSWSQVSTGLVSSGVRALAASADGDIFAGTTGGGVYRSSDNGDSWLPANAGLTSDDIVAIEVNNQGHVFAGSADAGIFRSVDNGDGWTAVNTGLQNTDVIVLALNSIGDIFAGTTSGGVYRSQDNGDTWSQTNTGLTTPDINAIVVNRNGDIFAGTQRGGVFRSRDNGDTWNQLNAELTTGDVFSLAVNNKGDIFAGTDIAVFRNFGAAKDILPLKWLNIGELHSPYAKNGAVHESTPGVTEGDILKYPAIERYSGNAWSYGLWAGARNFTDEGGRVFPYKVSHIGPRLDTSEYFASAFTMSGRFQTEVYVDGMLSFEHIVLLGEIVPDLKSERRLKMKFNNRLGLEFEQTVHAFSQEYHDNYHIIEYTITNTGNVDDDPEAELNADLEGVYIFYATRITSHVGSAWVNSTGQIWGHNTMNDIVGDGLEDYGVDFRAQYAWAGYASDRTVWSTIGGPMMGPGNSWVAADDTSGRLAAAQMAGRIYLHADTSPMDTTDDPGQPSLMAAFDSDSPVFEQDEFDDDLMMQQYTQLFEAGRETPSQAYKVQPDGDFAFGTGEPSYNGSSGGFSMVEAFGPYDIGIGESIHLVMAEGADGLSDEAKVEIGKQYKVNNRAGLPETTPIEYGGLSMAKNEWVMTTRDSLFDTFRRARANYESGFAIPEPPMPPKIFSITSKTDRITLSWETFPTSPDPGSWEIWRTITRYDNATGYTLIAQLPGSGQKIHT